MLAGCSDLLSVCFLVVASDLLLLAPSLMLDALLGFVLDSYNKSKL
jgi:hypothetical protein